MNKQIANPRHNQRDVYPPTGTEITCKSWLTEAPMRMLMNNLHPDVAESPHELVVYGGIVQNLQTQGHRIFYVRKIVTYVKSRRGQDCTATVINEEACVVVC